MSEYVFAYGSNMCSGRFRDYSLTPEGDGLAALLPEHRLAFNKLSQNDRSGKANVEPDRAAQVWGVLYAIPSTDLATLDRGEGGYSREKRFVHTLDAAVNDAWVYVASKPRNDLNLRPYTWYKRFLVEGDRAWPPAEYIAVLEQVDAAEDSDKERDRSKRLLSCARIPLDDMGQ